MDMFNPDVDGIQVPSWDDALQKVDALIERFRHYTAHRYPEVGSFAQAFRDTFKAPCGMSTPLGDRDLYQHFQRILARARSMLRNEVEPMLSVFASRLEAVDEVGNAHDPIALIRLCERPLDPRARLKERRIWFEARRQLAIACQWVVMNMNDPNHEISDDISHLTRLANERLFQGELRQVWIVAALDINDDMRVQGVRDAADNPDVWVHFSAERAEASKRMLEAAGRSYYANDGQDCRVIDVGKQRYFVWDQNSVKDEQARLVKYYSRAVRDARRSRLIVVAVMPKTGGRLRVATRKHVHHLKRHVRRRLWRSELVLEDRTARSPHRSPRFWSVKNTGHLIRERDGRLICRPVEQQITSIADHVSAITSHADDRHSFYRGRMILHDVAPKWYGHLDDIDWSSAELEQRLRAAWARNLPDISYLSVRDRDILRARNGH